MRREKRNQRSILVKIKILLSDDGGDCTREYFYTSLLHLFLFFPLPSLSLSLFHARACACEQMNSFRYLHSSSIVPMHLPLRLLLPPFFSFLLCLLFLFSAVVSSLLSLSFSFSRARKTVSFASLMRMHKRELLLLSLHKRESLSSLLFVLSLASIVEKLFSTATLLSFLFSIFSPSRASLFSSLYLLFSSFFLKYARWRKFSPLHCPSLSLLHA